MGSSFSSFWGLRVLGSLGLRFIGLCFRDTPAMRPCVLTLWWGDPIRRNGGMTERHGGMAEWRNILKHGMTEYPKTRNDGIF